MPIEFNRYIHYVQWIYFIGICTSNDLSKGTNRHEAHQYLAANLHSKKDSSDWIDLYNSEYIEHFTNILYFFSQLFVVDYEKSKGNRTELLDIEFNKSLRIFWDSIKTINLSLKKLP